MFFEVTDLYYLSGQITSVDPGVTGKMGAGDDVGTKEEGLGSGPPHQLIIVGLLLQR